MLFGPIWFPSSWDECKEWLVPADALKKSSAPKYDLAIARSFVFVLYCLLGGVFCYTLYFLLYSGRVEVYRGGYKVDRIEAPSFVICPFWPDTAIRRPNNTRWAEGTRAYLTTLEGGHNVDAKAFPCRFDRDCVCMNMFKTVDGRRQFEFLQDYDDERSQHTGAGRGYSDREQKFHDKVVLRTNLVDSSDDQTLKIGFYDSVDPSPFWFYVNQGSYVLGTLELQTWTVTDWSLRGLARLLRGDISAMADRRHLYKFFSQSVGQRGSEGRSANETQISYEMLNFFVEETVSSETAWSGYTLLVLLAMFMLRTPIIHACIDALMPGIQEEKQPDRELSGWAQCLGGCLCCCCLRRPSRADEQEGVTRRLTA